jgi:hypothetical protein
MKPGRHGFHIRCPGCNKEFESTGLRCCSTECERRYRESDENAKLMAKVGIEAAAKRRCECCGGVIPKWAKGRRVSKAKKFCSEKCAKRAKRANKRRGMASDSRTTFLSAKTIKKRP